MPKLNLTREQLAKFLPDHQSIRAFEQLFESVEVTLPDSGEEANNNAGLAIAIANAASSAIADMLGLLELISNAPAQADKPEAEDLVPAVHRGTISVQNADAVEITGGTIDGVTIGGSTPGAGTFTVLRGNSLAKVIADTPTSQAVATGTNVDITNWTERLDVGGDFNPVTGIFTAPRTAKYSMSASIGYSAVAYGAAGQEADILVLKNGATVRSARRFVSAAATTQMMGDISVACMDLTAGDTIKITAFQNSGNTANTASSFNTRFEITELP